MIYRVTVFMASVLTGAIALSGTALAQGPVPLNDTALVAIARDFKVAKVLDALKENDARTLDEHKRFAQIPSPIGSAQTYLRKEQNY